MHAGALRLHEKTISVLTYNVSHEAMGGKSDSRHSAHVLGRKCAQSVHVRGKNACFRNVKQICSHYPYSFIGLQEVDNGIDKAVKESLELQHVPGYDIVSTRFLSIVYDKSDFVAVGSPYKGYVVDHKGIPQKGRSIVGQLFISQWDTKPIAVINMHCPHTGYNTGYSIRYNIARALHALKRQSPMTIERVIVMGDFNKEHMYPFHVSLDRGSKLSFRPAINSKDHVTGWDVRGEGTSSADLKYTMSVDNVMVAGGVTNDPETWNTSGAFRTLLPKGPSIVTGKKFPILTSDHSPVAVNVVFE